MNSHVLVCILYILYWIWSIYTYMPGTFIAVVLSAKRGDGVVGLGWAGDAKNGLIRLNSPTGTVPFVSEEFNSDKYRRRRRRRETINLNGGNLVGGRAGLLLLQYIRATIVKTSNVRLRALAGKMVK